MPSRSKQIEAAKVEGVSNCLYCVIGHDANCTRIWKLSEMDADHVTAWSKGGETDIANCLMLCKTRNKAKGIASIKNGFCYTINAFNTINFDL